MFNLNQKYLKNKGKIYFNNRIKNDFIFYINEEIFLNIIYFNFIQNCYYIIFNGNSIFKNF